MPRGSQGRGILAAIYCYILFLHDYTHAMSEPAVVPHCYRRQPCPADGLDDGKEGQWALLSPGIMLLTH